MKTSVIIATYNGEKFIEEQLDSILIQSVQPDEVIITDDGSKDNTVEIVQHYIDNHGLKNSWHLYVNEQNKGYAKNFLDGVMLTTGDIVFLCDQDDIWIYDRVEKISNVMKNHPEFNLLCTNLEPFYCDDNTRKWDKKTLSEMKNDESMSLHSLVDRDYHVKRSGCTMCVRKEFVRKVYKYWIRGWAHDDFFWKMAACSNSGGLFQYTSMKRRMHANNASVLKTRSQKWRLEELELFERINYQLEKYMDNNKYKVKNITNTIKKNKKAISLRIELIKNKKCSIGYY